MAAQIKFLERKMYSAFMTCIYVIKYRLRNVYTFNLKENQVNSNGTNIPK